MYYMGSFGITEADPYRLKNDCHQSRNRYSQRDRYP